ncbi:hypothetical protein [Mycolicibacterium litorale]|nr:hypothetical protein [Mycolicibacterium litorale]
MQRRFRLAAELATRGAPRWNPRTDLVTMCAGGGMGTATIIERI